MNPLDALIKGLVNAKEPLMAILIFVVIISVILYMILDLAFKPGEGLQTLVTNLTGDYRTSNGHVIRLTEKVGELSTRLAQVQMEVSILTNRAAAADIAAKDAKDRLREALDKLDMVTDELSVVHRELNGAKVLVGIKEGRIVELEIHTTSLKEEVDSLRAQIVLLQSVQTKILGEDST